MNLLDQRLAALCSSASDLLEQLVELRALRERIRNAERTASENGKIATPCNRASVITSSAIAPARGRVRRRR